MAEITKKERDAAGRYMKGVSGNPHGRPATPENVKEMLKAATVPALQLLIATLEDESAKLDLRVRCAETVLDRVLGRAVQPLEAVFTAPAVDLSDFTIEELRRLAAYGEQGEPEDQDGGAGGEA